MNYYFTIQFQYSTEYKPNANRSKNGSNVHDVNQLKNVLDLL